MSLAHATRDNPTAAAHRIGSDDEALETARELAALFARESIQRDRERRLPLEELELFSAPACGASRCSREYGGAGVSRVTLAKVVAIVSAADSSLGQIPQNHFYALEVLRVNGSPAQKGRLSGAALAGERFGNALAEIGTRTASERRTRLRADGDGYRLDGRKFYCTGALYAQRVPTLAVDDEGRQQLAFVPRDSAGLEIVDDWSGFGQRTTGSGSALFDRVAVAAEDVVSFQDAFERPTTVGPLAQILHAAIDAGIARGAFEDTLRFVRERARPWVDSGVDKASDDPLTIHADRPPGDPPARRRSAAGACRAGARPGHRRAGRGKRGGRLDRRRRSPRADHRGRPAGRQQADRAWRQPRLSRRTRSRPPLAQRPRTHPARPGALEVPRGRRLLPQRPPAATPRHALNAEGTAMSKKQILLNAFSMNCVGHINHGLWTHPRDRSSDYRKLRHWTELARLLERGLFDGLFIADILGVYDVYQGGIEVTAREAVQLPVNDPLMLVSAMAGVTEHLGFGVTANLTYEAPYPFARRLSTLDHLSDGRIGWNIVTGYLESAAKAMGQSAQIEHDRRYDRADEYLEVLYKLWEGSWEDDAVLADRQRRALRAAGEDPQDPPPWRVLPGRGLPPRRALSTAHPGAVPGRLAGVAWPSPRATPNACSSPDRPARPPANWCSASARRWSAPAVAPRTSGSSWAST